MDDPIYQKRIKRGVRNFLIVFFSVLLLFLATHPDESWTPDLTLVFALILLASSGGALWFEWGIEYHSRPYQVEIRDDGVLCKFRLLRKDLFLPWDRIISIRTPSDDPAKQHLDNQRDQTLWFVAELMPHGVSCVYLHRPITKVVRERYHERFGMYPLEYNWDSPHYRSKSKSRRTRST